MVKKHLISLSICVMLIAAMFILTQTVSIAATRGILRGKVLDANTGMPISQARLTLSAHGLSVIADNLGAYSFSDLLLGNTTLIVSATGYTSRSQNIVITGNVQYLDIVLTPQQSTQAQLPKNKWLSFGGGIYKGQKVEKTIFETKMGTSEFIETADIGGLELEGELRQGPLALQAQFINSKIDQLDYNGQSYPVDTSNYGSMSIIAKLVLPIIPSLEIAALGGYEKINYTYDIYGLVNHTRYSDDASVYAQPGYTHITKGVVYGGELTLRPSTRIKLSGNVRYSPAMNTYTGYTYYLNSAKTFWDNDAYSNYKTTMLTYRVTGEMALLPSLLISASYINVYSNTPPNTKAKATSSTNYPSNYTWDFGQVNVPVTNDRLDAYYIGAKLQF